MTGWLVAVLVAGAGAAAALAGAAWWLGRPLVLVTVEGASMQPTLQPGDRLLVRRAGLDQLRVGQIVVVRFGLDGPPHWMIKRAVALPGDPVPRQGMPALRSVPEDRVPPGHLVVAGDNAAHSNDSRQMGYFAAAGLLGVVVRPALSRPALSRADQRQTYASGDRLT